ncbi:hypothetical protein TRAPUB_6921 [Trametes pubescens]|uniref:Uncharacterized protein n=1 Tax=Trametes pubescens TaxID=154538 RepID=A0A1M2V4S2_TRAPU|nr:hypothetical protein TRAPUB_6921 [Trametes pubescens]
MEPGEDLRVVRAVHVQPSANAKLVEIHQERRQVGNAKGAEVLGGEQDRIGDGVQSIARDTQAPKSSAVVS